MLHLKNAGVEKIGLPSTYHFKFCSETSSKAF